MIKIVSTHWVYKNLKNKNLVIFDCSWEMSKSSKKLENDFKKLHIKNSHFFDIDQISNKRIKLPHMVPSKKLFEKKMQDFGVNNSSSVVVYDNQGIYSSPRVWWLFKYFGHKKIFVMNGGLLKWFKEKKPLTNKMYKAKKGNFTAKINNELIIKYEEVIKSINNKNYLIIDVRKEDRFQGLIKEPRPSSKLGHIPNSENLFWGKLIKKNGTISSKITLNKLFNKYKLNKRKKIITSCGSGITACILSLALEYSNNISSKVYDGSWSEWSNRKGSPIEK